MREQSSAFLEKARSSVGKAQDLLDVLHWPEDAGRPAYLAGLHAAQALIFERTGNIAKSHRGVQHEFGRLTKDDPKFDVDLRTFLGRTYDFKAIADYLTGSDSQISIEQAQQAIATARRFIETIAVSLGAEPDRSR